MNLLMITRKVDARDDRAGHTYRWISRISERLVQSSGQLSVVCLEAGEVGGLPANVTVRSLGKERGVPRRLRWLRFLVVVWPLLKTCDAIFCHQNPEYTIAVWPWAKLRRKRIVSWYTHGAVTWKTKLVARLADVVLTASAESFRIETPKRRIVGHGIDTEQFKLPHRRLLDPTRLRIVSVGRISPTKDYETLILAVAKLRRPEALNTDDGNPVAVTLAIVGAPAVPNDQVYFTTLRELAGTMQLQAMISFVGPVPHDAVAQWYQPERADLMVNLSGTGSVDKAVLEAMACGLPVITSNPAFAGILPAEFLVPANDPVKLAQAIAGFFQRYGHAGANFEFQVSRPLRQTVVQSHSLSHLVEEIIVACRA